MTYETQERLMFLGMGLLGGLIILMIVALPFLMIAEGKHVAEMKTACEAKNGALLDHTTRVGKTTHHEYVCIDKNLIIEY